MKLELQYKNYLKNNPESSLTLDQWKNEVLGPMLQKALSEAEDQNSGVVWFDTETGKLNTENDEN
jgi:hypothetical protein